MTQAKESRRQFDREDLMLLLFAFTPVIAWLAAQELSFLETRSVCATGHRWVLYLVMGTALAATAAAGTASWRKSQALASKAPSNRIHMYRRFIALGGVLLASICGLSIFALMIPAAIHRLCD